MSGRCSAIPRSGRNTRTSTGPSAQRFYNTLCLAYGGEREWFKDFVDKGWLPKERADNCANEYQQVKYAFVKTILPFIDQDLMKKVQARDWLKAAAPSPGAAPAPGGPSGPGGPGTGGTAASVLRRVTSDGQSLAR